MTEERKGFTIRVHGDVPESAVEGLIAAIPGPVSVERCSILQQPESDGINALVPGHYVKLFGIPLEEPIDPQELAGAEKLVRAGYTFTERVPNSIAIENDPDAKAYRLTDEQAHVFHAALMKVRAEREHGTGSEMSRMMAIALDPNPLKTAEERIALDAVRAFERAKKIDATEYSGWVSWPGHGDDGFFESVDELRKHCARQGMALPAFVWACTPEPLRLEANWILDQALLEHHDGARGEVSSSEELRLQKFLDEWCAAQGIVSWHEDRTRAVMLTVEPANRNNTTKERVTEMNDSTTAPKLKVGDRVTATHQITEAGGEVVGDPNAVFPAPNYIHAEDGELGTVEHCEAGPNGEPTVRFDRTRTATIVAHREIAVESAVNDGSQVTAPTST